MKKEAALAAQIMDAIPRIMRVVRREIHRGRGRLTLPQYRILSQIDSGICQVGLLADRHGTSQPTMSKIVDGLVKRGLVRRVAHSSDRRRIELVLTTKGKILHGDIKTRTEGALARILQSLSGAQRSKVSDAVNTLIVAFGKKGEQTP